MRFLKNQRGIAMIIALFSVTLMIYLAVETSYETNVEYLISAQGPNRIKAYYAAKSGLELALLRIHIYKKAMHQLGSVLGDNAAMLDSIWNVPFIWPPVLPEESSLVDQELIQEKVKESLSDTQFATTISSEGSKIDLNDLGSSSEALQKTAKKQLMNIFLNEIENNDEITDTLRDLNYEELINNIADWVDEDETGSNGGDESSLYQTSSDEKLPPNRPFRTLQELHMVSGMTDEIFALLKPRITIYGEKGININHANKEVLMSLHPTITSENADEIIKRREDKELGGPFKKEEDFYNFINTLPGVYIDPNSEDEEKLPLVFDAPYNFLVKSTGQFGRTTREIIAIVYDFDKVASRLAKHVKVDKPDQSQSGTNPDSTGQGSTSDSKSDQDKKTDEKKSSSKSKSAKPPKGRPRIVYYMEN